MSVDIIYFAQHGIAVNKSDNSERPLSAQGIRQTRTIANHLNTQNVRISHIFHSDKLRSQQTAEEFASILSISKLSEIKTLSPNDSIALIKQNLNINAALYIGHLPHMEKLVSDLITGDENTGIIKFKNSAVVCLEKKDDLYEAAWYLTPSLTHNKT